jgi:sugar transferase (PEP-CTERM system associated)
LLLGAEMAAVWAAIYIGRLLPLIGLPAVVPSYTGSGIPATILLTLLVLGGLDLAGLYDMRRQYSRIETLIRVATGLSVAYLLLAVFAFLMPGFKPTRHAYVLSFFILLPLVYGIRIVHGDLTPRERRRRRVLLLGAGTVSRMLAKLATPESGYEVVGCIRGHAEAASDGADGPKIFGSMDDFALTVKTVKPDVLVAAMEERRAALPIDSILECKLGGVEVEDWPTFYEKLTAKLLVSHLRPSWLVFSDGFKRSRIDDLLKRGVDVVVSAILGLAALPVCLLAAVMIKLDSRGPVFFRQERVGEGGRVFTLMKFRTMRQNAERETGPVWAQTDDPRITRVGRILRTTRIDEIPQFINVLCGDMSLVGPRPERPPFVVELSEKLPFYMYRHVVKPGITGWAQVRYRYGSSLEDSREKLEYDLYYVKNRSLFLDLLIIIQTIQVVVFSRGAR